jgi:pimeloyl-ACP methyl ester carboxylesterase
MFSIANKSVDIEGLKIAYKDEGGGQILLCLHALGHSSKDFNSIYGLQLNNFRVISIDFPNHGNSGSAKEAISATYLYQITAKFIEKLDLKNIIVIGNSIGGAVAIRLASNNPNIKMLSLSNPAVIDKRGLFFRPFLDYMIHFFKQGVQKKPNFKKSFSNYYHKVLTSKTASERRNEIIQECYSIAPLLVEVWTSFKLDSEDLRPIISTVNCPVLFTWGMDDKFVQFSRNKQAIEKFSNYKLIKYQIGHTPYIECPVLFLNDLIEYMSQSFN